MLLRTLATPMLSATYPDQLGRGSGWARQVPIARGGPMAGAAQEGCLAHAYITIHMGTHMNCYICMYDVCISHRILPHAALIYTKVYVASM